MNTRGLLCALIVGLAGAMGGCASWFEDDGAEQAPITKAAPTAPLPEYAAVARAYNERIEPLDRLFARANIRLTYIDEKGETKTEEPEGRLQIARPDRLALSLGKAGQIILWFGCDEERYWWFDLSESSNRIVAVGRHDLYTDEVGRRIGIAIRPMDLIGVLGIVPMDPDGRGATQWSRDGRTLGATVALPRGGYQRTWMDPKTYMPTSIEIFNEAKSLIVVSKHEGTESVELASGRFRPPIAARITVRHLQSKTEARLSLTGIKDSGVSERAFKLDELLERYPVDRAIDLDAPRPARGAPRAFGGG